MRRSISRIDERYSSSLRRSEVPRSAAHLRRALVDEIEDAAAISQAARPSLRRDARVDVAKQAFEDQARVGFRGHRRRRAAPRQAVGVRARIPRVAVADGPRVVAPEFERTEPRVLADVLGRDLVDRDAVLDVGTGGLARVHASQVGRGGTGMVARTVTKRGAIPMPEARKDQGVLAERLERLHHPRVLEPGAGRRRGPLIHRDPVGDVRECQPDRRFGDVRRAGECGRHRIEHRQRDDGPHSLEERAARHVSARDDHGVAAPVGAALRDWKGRLLTISRTSAENL